RPVSPYSCCCAAPPTTAPYTLSLHDALPISPFAFAGHHHVHVEGGEQAEAFGAGVVVHARERLVQCDQARRVRVARRLVVRGRGDRKSTRLNSSHVKISYAVFCLKKKKTTMT